MEVNAKSRLRITIESLLIDLNEEIFALSEELAKSYSGEQARILVTKAREFDLRKKNLIKRVVKTIEEDQIARIVSREFKIQMRTRSQSSSCSRSGSRSRSRSGGKRFHPLRNKSIYASQTHSPPEREKTTTTHKLLEKYQSSKLQGDYIDTEDKPIVNIAADGRDKRNGNDRFFAMSYENTISTQQQKPEIVPAMPQVIH